MRDCREEHGRAWAARHKAGPYGLPALAGALGDGVWGARFLEGAKSEKKQDYAKQSQEVL